METLNILFYNSIIGIGGGLSVGFLIGLIIGRFTLYQRMWKATFTHLASLLVGKSLEELLTSKSNLVRNYASYYLRKKGFKDVPTLSWKEVAREISSELQLSNNLTYIYVIVVLGIVLISVVLIGCSTYLCATKFMIESGYHYVPPVRAMDGYWTKEQE